MIIQNGKSRCFAYNSNRSEAGIAQPQPRVQRLLAGAGGQLEQKALHGTLLAREERAMQSFLFKLAASAREEPLHTRLRLRYTCL